MPPEIACILCALGVCLGFVLAWLYEREIVNVLQRELAAVRAELSRRDVQLNERTERDGRLVNELLERYDLYVGDEPTPLEPTPAGHERVNEAAELLRGRKLRRTEERAWRENFGPVAEEATVGEQP